MSESLAAETGALKDAYAALNRNDIPAMIEAFDPDIDWTDPAGTFHGIAELKEHIARTRATWAEGSCEPERFLVVGDKVIVFVHVHVIVKHNRELAEGRLADVYTFRNGKAIHMRTFLDRRQAIEWAGGDPSDVD